MNEAAFVLLSALFLLLPVGVKYSLAFRTRKLVAQLKQTERAVQRLSAELEAAQSESLVLGRALRQVDQKRRQALTRKTIIEERLREQQGQSGAEQPAAAQPAAAQPSAAQPAAA